MRRAPGFTLVELMMVVAIIGVFAGLAMVSFGKTKSHADLDRFAADVRDTMTRARRRAVATQSTYLVDVRANSVAYCQVDPNGDPFLGKAPAQVACPTAAAAVCNGGVACESVAPLQAGPRATALQWANIADLAQGGGAVAAIGPGGAQVYMLRSGAADSIPGTPVADGFTVYLQSPEDAAQRRKVVLFPAAGRPRVIDTW